MLNSYFYEGMEFSHIFYLNDLAEIILYPVGEGPQTGEATHGEGVTLIINETSYPVNFADLPNPELTERPLADFVPDNIMSFYTMSDSFSYDQVRVLYDYRLIPYDGGDECFPVTWDEIDAETDAPMVDLSSGLPVVTGLAGCDDVDDLFTIEMVRKVIVDDGVSEEVFYWEDLATVTIDDEEVVFLDTLLDTAGISEAEKVENDYFLFASDDFGTYFPYGHHHLEDMYFIAPREQDLRHLTTTRLAAGHAGIRRQILCEGTARDRAPTDSAGSAVSLCGRCARYGLALGSGRRLHLQRLPCETGGGGHSGQLRPVPHDAVGRKEKKVLGISSPPFPSEAVVGGGLIPNT